ncbi:hypothetical protein D3C87_1590520 [compost metagenome]
MACLGDGGLCVEGQVGIDFRRYAAGNQTCKGCTDGNGKTVGNGRNDSVRLAALFLAPGNGFLHRIRKSGGAERLQNDGGVGGAIHRLQARDRLDVAGIGNDRGDSAKLFEFGRHGE